MSPVETLNDLYFHALETYRKPAAFRFKEGGVWRDVSSEAFKTRGSEIALGLVSLGMERGDRVAVLSENRVEWAAADMGILTAGLVSVPIYPTLPPPAVEYILENSGARAIFVSTDAQLAKLDGFRGRHPEVRLIRFDGGGSEGVLTLDALQERGRELGRAEPELHRRRSDAVAADDVATLIYTSGTTGSPKGVMLTHRNIVSNVTSSLEAFDIGSTDTCLSFLPLSHILERMAGLYIMVHTGCTIAYAESVDTVPENMIEVAPTIMISVPRLYEKMYARVMEAAQSGGAVKRALFRWAVGVGAERAKLVLDRKPVPGGLAFKYRIATALVFRKLHARTGGRIRFFVSGGAPLAREIAEFFFGGGLTILEGYGLTESSPVLAVNTLDDIRMGTVGKPISAVEIRIAEDGEILARGPNIMKGYFNLPEATAEALHDGWLYTGDVGHLDPDGFLVITDRKKDIIVNAGGKNIAPQPIENAVKTDEMIDEIVVLGDRRPYLVALVVPNFPALEAAARALNIPIASREELVRDPRIVRLVEERIAAHQAEAASFETIRRIRILDRPLTIDDGALTPTLKVKRREMARRYAAEIEALYGG